MWKQPKQKKVVRPALPSLNLLLPWLETAIQDERQTGTMTLTSARSYSKFYTTENWI